MQGVKTLPNKSSAKAGEDQRNWSNNSKQSQADNYNASRDQAKSGQSIVTENKLSLSGHIAHISGGKMHPKIQAEDAYVK